MILPNFTLLKRPYILTPRKRNSSAPTPPTLSRFLPTSLHLPSGGDDDDDDDDDGDDDNNTLSRCYH